MKKLELWNKLAQSCGWWYPYENICFVCDRFATLHQDSKNRLHNPNGPAMSFRDGYSVYAINGIRVPGWIVEEPEQITPQKITNEANAEIRRVMIGKYGWHKMLDNLNAKLIDKHENPIFGELYRWHEPDGVEVQIIYVQNGSQNEEGKYEHYSLRVPLEFSNVVEAHRWTHPRLRNMPLDDYILMNSSRT